MTDPNLKVGDTAIDLVERGHLQIVEKAAETVAAYRDREDFDLATYKSHPLLHVAEDEPVFTAVYLPKNPTVEVGGTYDFPASRLARIPVEEANQRLVRTQHDLAINLCHALLDAYDDVEDEDVHRLEVAMETTLGEELAGAVFELADVDRRFGGDDGA